MICTVKAKFDFLSVTILIKFSSLSAPTKIEELTIGSDEKTQRSPAGVLLSLLELEEKRI